MQVFPLEVVRRRMQTLAAAGLSRGSSMAAVRQAIMDIWAKERLRGFYAGMLPNTIQVPSRWLLHWQASEEHCCMWHFEAQRRLYGFHAGMLLNTIKMCSCQLLHQQA